MEVVPGSVFWRSLVTLINSLRISEKADILFSSWKTIGFSLEACLFSCWNYCRLWIIFLPCLYFYYLQDSAFSVPCYRIIYSVISIYLVSAEYFHSWAMKLSFWSNILPYMLGIGLYNFLSYLKMFKTDGSCYWLIELPYTNLVKQHIPTGWRNCCWCMRVYEVPGWVHVYECLWIFFLTSGQQRKVSDLKQTFQISTYPLLILLLRIFCCFYTRITQHRSC